MLDQSALSIIKSVVNENLDRSKYKVFVFGSRTQTKHRKFSDIDIGILGPKALPVLTLLQIKDGLSNSDIPYLVDVVDFSTVSENFKKIAMSKTISL